MDMLPNPQPQLRDPENRHGTQYRPNRCQSAPEIAVARLIWRLCSRLPGAGHLRSCLPKAFNWWQASMFMSLWLAAKAEVGAIHWIIYRASELGRGSRIVLGPWCDLA